MSNHPLKYLYYTPLSWPHLPCRPQSFPHSNEAYDAERGAILFRESLALFQMAERSGFDWLGIGEEHMNAYGVVPNPCLIASALGPLTTTAKICVLGNPLPLLNPLRVAEEYAMVDALSDGRLVAGFPRGVPQNYAAYGMSAENSRAQLREAVEFVVSAWLRRGPFDWAGSHYQFKNVSIWPQPKRLPEMVFSAKSVESVDLALDHKGILAELYVKNQSVLQHFQNSIQNYTKGANERGWTPNADRFLLNIPCFISKNDRLAREKAHKALTYVSTVVTGSYEVQKQELRDSFYKDVKSLPFGNETLEEKIAYGGVVCGSPSTAIDSIRRLVRRFGVGILGLQMQIGNTSYTDVVESLSLFSRYVKDEVRAQ